MNERQVSGSHWIRLNGFYWGAKPPGGFRPSYCRSRTSAVIPKADRQLFIGAEDRTAAVDRLELLGRGRPTWGRNHIKSG